MYLELACWKSRSLSRSGRAGVPQFFENTLKDYLKNQNISENYVWFCKSLWNINTEEMTLNLNYTQRSIVVEKVIEFQFMSRFFAWLAISKWLFTTNIAPKAIKEGIHKFIARKSHEMSTSLNKSFKFCIYKTFNQGNKVIKRSLWMTPITVHLCADNKIPILDQTYFWISDTW